jgi:hypothetical protein
MDKWVIAVWLFAIAAGVMFWWMVASIVIEYF